MIYQFGNIRLDIARQELWRGSKTTGGELMVLDLLRPLVEIHDRLVVPAVLLEAVDNRYYDDFRPISESSAIDWARTPASQEGILTGISGGASFAAAIEVAEQSNSGSDVLCTLPDTGERNLTTPLFEGIAEDMTEEEVVISRSTPN